MIKMRATILMLVLGVVAASSMTASVVSGLCNTGITGCAMSPAPIEAANTPDANWTVSSTADPTAKPMPVADIYPGWYPCGIVPCPTTPLGTATASWITPLTSSGAMDQAVGLYTYQETITVSEPGLLTVSGDYAADNCATILWDGGSIVGGMGTTLGGGVSSLTCNSSSSNFGNPAANPFSFSEGVTPGTYYLDVEVYNSSLVTGLLVDNLTATITPEPSAALLTLTGLVLLAGGIIRHRQLGNRS